MLLNTVAELMDSNSVFMCDSIHKADSGDSLLGLIFMPRALNEWTSEYLSNNIA